MRHLPIQLSIVLVVLCGCADRQPNRGALDERSTRAAIAPPPFDASQPFDTRLARLRPDDHVGQERLCDVTFAGTAEAITHRIGGRYAERYVVRKLIRCGSLLGESWADLVFADGARSFASVVATGMRLKVRVVAADGGFEDATVLEFLTVVTGPKDLTPPRETTANLSAAFDFGAVRRDARLVGQRRVCSVAYVGPIRRVTRADADLYPRGASHHVSVLCHHAVGDAWVEVLASARTSFGLLELERGHRITMEIRSRGGGPADHPFVVLAPQTASPVPHPI